MVTINEQKRTEFARLRWSGHSLYMCYSALHKKGLHVPVGTLKHWNVQLSGNPHTFLTGGKKSRQGNPKANRKGARPLSRGDKMRIRACIRAHPRQPARTTAAHLPEGIVASYSTVRRIRIKAGIKALHEYPKPKLTRTQKKERRVFSRANRTREWAVVVFTDEFTCTTNGTVLVQSPLACRLLM
jgi:hypothetical protein